jgi:hypothetical protein
MILLPIESVAPFINDYYMKYSDGELLGFMPCSTVENNYAKYFSVETTKGSRVVPVFYMKSFVFDSDKSDDDRGPALFFKGCDDGHMGLHFKDRDEALKWIDEQPITDFEFLVQIDTMNYRAGQRSIPFCYHN